MPGSPKTTDMTRWDGVPPDPEKNQWHWLQGKFGGHPTPWFWTDEDAAPGEFSWATDGDAYPDEMAKQFFYVSPCAYPEGIKHD